MRIYEKLHKFIYYVLKNKKNRGVLPDAPIKHNEQVEFIP